MNKRISLILAVVFLLALIIVMSWDLFFKNENQSGNPYEYKLDNLKNIDTTLLCYKEIQSIPIKDTQVYGISLDSEDNIYVSGDNIVMSFNKQGEEISHFNVEGSANCITVAKDGEIYLSFKDHIEIWNKKGKLLQKWDTINSVAYITSIAIDSTSVFLADAGNKIVHQYNKKGELINKIGKRNKDAGILGFFIPSPYFDVVLGRDGEIWAINTGRHNFEAYDKEGNLISSWKKRSMTIEGFSGCCNPSHVAMLSDGSFVTTEKGLVRVKVHRANGDLKCVVAKPEHFEEGTRGLDVAVDSKDRIIILDPERKMVRIFVRNNKLKDF